jgi:hypothetical protein
LKQTQEDRAKIAQKRLLRVLEKHGVAIMRTLEQKISDAGPNPLRIDPHILTTVRNALVTQKRLTKLTAAGINWYYRADTSAQIIQERLAEQLAVYKAFSHPLLTQRTGQALEIATYRALLQLPHGDFFGRYVDLHEHGDDTLYSKEEPPTHISGRSLPGKKKLDFLVCSPSAEWLGIECKNIREWLYPNRTEIHDMLTKCLSLNCIPVLIGRRIPFVTSHLLRSCGVIIHQTFNQLLPSSAQDVADKAKNKLLLGYHDIRTGNTPDHRLITFITKNLLPLVPDAREKYDRYRDLLEAFASQTMPFEEFAERVRRRNYGESEDELDYPDHDPDDY